jgi:valyl-tRNA synthetase
MRFSDEKIEAARNFNNKIWNAARFVLMNLELEEISLPDAADLEIEDKWILSRLNTVTKEVCDNLDHYELGIALAKLYDFVWSEFCDWYIELLKPRFADKGSKTNVVAQNTIGYVLIGIMKLLHPYMPFITEEIYASLPTLKEESTESIMISTYPAYKEELSFVQDEERMEKLIDLIRAIRNRRAEMNVPPSKKAQLYVVSERSDVYNENTVRFFEKLASASSVTYCAAVEDKTAVQIVAGGATVFIPMGDLVDLEKEKVRLAGEVKKVQGEIARLDGKLSNAGFIAKAPAAVVEGEKAKLEKYKETLAQLEEALSKI